ncbi:hypothetical protein PSH76_13545 [Pseudomonas sp. FP215]|uniref:hypothetical protein n=1 Tax=Pseudomonas sp. FP215 TaxID=2738126 RepID=UPI002736EB0D|nr:hypothetical protein [Pseudomonas sp. FP215]WLH26791.1 hypothetical protein PSH76_13545 [Pseudomonas sp. FP215]
MKKLIKLFAVASVFTAVSANVMAADAYDYTALSGAVDFSAVGVAIMAVAALIAGLYAMFRGVKMVLSAIRS